MDDITLYDYLIKQSDAISMQIQDLRKQQEVFDQELNFFFPNGRPSK